MKHKNLSIDIMLFSRMEKLKKGINVNILKLTLVFYVKQQQSCDEKVTDFGSSNYGWHCKKGKEKMFAAQTTHSRFSFSRTKSALGSEHSFSRFFFSKCLSIQVKADVKHAVLSLSRTVPSFSQQAGFKKGRKSLKK